MRARSGSSIFGRARTRGCGIVLSKSTERLIAAMTLVCSVCSTMGGGTGETVIDIPLDERFARRYGNPYAVTHRADIHGALLDGCRTNPLIELRSDARVGGFDVAENSVTVKIQNGKPVIGCALVG